MPHEQWGGEVKMPALAAAPAAHAWSVARRHARGVHEARKPRDGPSSLENANRAGSGALVDLYNEDRRHRQERRSKRQ